jgi:hypothetical protein
MHCHEQFLVGYRAIIGARLFFENARLFFKNAWHFKDIFREFEAFKDFVYF